MPVAEKTQVLRALERANELRLGRSQERKELRQAPADRIEAALLDPSDALATYKLGQLLAPSGNGNGIVPQFGQLLLDRILRQLVGSNPHGRRWNRETKLGDLTERERRRLVGALQPYLPKGDTP